MSIGIGRYVFNERVSVAQAVGLLLIAAASPASASARRRADLTSLSGKPCSPTIAHVRSQRRGRIADVGGVAWARRSVGCDAQGD
jgi:hypothetical protein